MNVCTKKEFEEKLPGFTQAPTSKNCVMKMKVKEKNDACLFLMERWSL